MFMGGHGRIKSALLVENLETSLQVFQGQRASQKLFFTVEGPLDPANILFPIAIFAPNCDRVLPLREDFLKDAARCMRDSILPCWLYAFKRRRTPGPSSIHMILHDRLLRYGNNCGITSIIQNLAPGNEYFAVAVCKWR
jgi:hypothetical protein